MSAMARGRIVPCPACDRMVTITSAGTYRAHREAPNGEVCAWGGVEYADEGPAAPPAPAKPTAEPQPVRESAVPVSSPVVMTPPRKSAPEPEPEPTPEPAPARPKRHTARVGTRGQFTLPPAVREAVGLEEGDVLACDVKPDGTIVLTPMRLQPLPPRA